MNFDEGNLELLKARILVTPISFVKPFEIFWTITCQFWAEGYPKQIHTYLGPYFTETVILAGIENIHINSDVGEVSDIKNMAFDELAETTSLTIDFKAHTNDFNVQKNITKTSSFKGCLNM